MPFGMSRMADSLDIPTALAGLWADIQAKYKTQTPPDLSTIIAFVRVKGAVEAELYDGELDLES